MEANSRYVGKPLLRLVECYVLWAIGELPEKESLSLLNMTPKLQALYETDGQWQDIMAGIIGSTGDMPGQLKALWRKNKEIARSNHVVLTPQEFTEMVVDNNFSI
ncbi:MAG: hypothetical protein E2576_07250 [Alcaligenaceae bacterium]|nr:hypothetical protein [Alcaligenaceae bacterium SAGV5]MPS50277.1 hypothetical protein [Alcaligenaceae bacterium SAGV3]MPT56507.1 hypothetical protein [Alcaligenaceae bacterium]